MALATFQQEVTSQSPVMGKILWKIYKAAHEGSSDVYFLDLLDSGLLLLLECVLLGGVHEPHSLDPRYGWMDWEAKKVD